MKEYREHVDSSTNLLILGDSQLISGWEDDATNLLIQKSKINPDQEINIKPTRWARPSEQPEGILLNLEEAIQRLPNLKYIVLNISPISISQNSVTKAHQRLYLTEDGFNKMSLDPMVSKAYFRSPTDFIYKSLIFVFPLLRLNSQFSSFMNSFLQTGDWEFGQKEKSENMKFLSVPFFERTSWTWRSYETDRQLTESDLYPIGFGKDFGQERLLSMEIWATVFQRIESRKLQCYVANLPFSPDLEREWDELNIRKQFEERVENLLKESNCSRIKVPKERVSNRTYFADWTHLNEKGRKEVTAWLLSKEFTKQ